MDSQMLTRISFSFRRTSIPSLSIYFFSFFCLFLLFLSLIKGTPTLQNLIFVSLLISVFFFVVKRLAFSVTSSGTREGESIRWFIGEEDRVSRKERCEKDWEREGVEFYSNGDCYEGEFYKGKCNGSGVYNFFVKGRYEGDWVDGKYDGYGIESWAKGSRYRGQYKQGMRHGFGVYRFYSGDCYAGEWMNGQSHGIGIQACFDGSSYVGEFKAGVKHGFGCYKFRNGDRYSGEYFSNMIHGFGIYYFDNGHCYEGSWHEGRRQGLGVYTFRNGDTMSGDWNSGVLKITLPPSDHAIQHSVQAARKAAENARLLPNVEEQMNKVVMAANRAANAARVAAIKAVQNHKDDKFNNNDQ